MVESKFTFKPNLNKVPIKVIRTDRIQSNIIYNYPNLSKRSFTNNFNL